MTSLDRAPSPTVKAVHTWSLFRTMGRLVAPGSMPSGGLPEGGGPGLDLLELPAELARHGFRSAQLCHFYLRSREPSYLAEVRGAFTDADVQLECLLIDDGDLAHPSDGSAQLEWLSSWVATAEHLQPTRVRVPAGKQPPTPDSVAASARRLTELAGRHTSVRIVVENWHALLADAEAVNTVLDHTDGRIGFLVDLGNWTGPTKYAELAAVARRAETCQAKVSTDDRGVIDETDFLRCLTILRDADYAGPLALVHDGADPDEWGKLDEAYALAQQVFPGGSAADGV